MARGIFDDIRVSDHMKTQRCKRERIELKNKIINILNKLNVEYYLSDWDFRIDGESKDIQNIKNTTDFLSIVNIPHVRVVQSPKGLHILI